MLLDLSQSVSRKLIEHPNFAWALVIGKRCRAERGEFFEQSPGGGRWPAQRLEHDGGNDPLSPDPIRRSHHGHLPDSRMPAQDILNLASRDLEAAGLDEVDGLAPDDREAP